MDKFRNRYPEALWKTHQFAGLDRRAEVTTREATSWLRGAHEPFFLFVHYFDAHGPYGDTGDEDITFKVIERAIRQGRPTAELVSLAQRLYAQDVAFLDRQLDRLFERLAEDAQGIQTHVVVFADHGESLGDGGWFGHGKGLSAEQILVPCFVLSPTLTPARVDTPVGSLDVAATVVGFAGISLGMDLGRDLCGELVSRPVMGMRRIFETPYGDLRLDGTTRRVEGKSFYLVDGERVYEGDAEMVVGSHGTAVDVPVERAARIRTLFQRFSDELGGIETGEVTDPAFEAALEALGYAR